MTTSNHDQQWRIDVTSRKNLEVNAGLGCEKSFRMLHLKEKNLFHGKAQKGIPIP
jgi:hypothetical protein